LPLLPQIAANTFSKRRDLGVAGGLFIIALAVYLRTLRQTFGWGDSAELTTAAYFLGIGHAPGYPTYMLLAYPFAHLPFATVAYRMNFMSAFFGAFTIALSYYAFRRLTLTRLGAALAALCFAFTTTFWDLTTDADVFTLHHTLATAIILVVLSWRGNGRPHLAWAAFLCGLSLGNHALTMLLLPAIFYLVIATRGFRYLFSKPMLFAALAFFIGLSVYFYLPLRGPANPPPSVNDPQTLKDLFLHITASGSRDSMFDVSARQLLGRTWLYGGRLLREVGWPGIALGLFGVGLLWRRDKRLWAFLGLIFAVDIFYSINFSIFDIYAYFAISYWVWCAIIGLGGEKTVALAERAIEKLQGRPDSVGPRFRRVLAGSLALLVPFLLLTGHWRKVDASAERAPEEFAHAVMGLVEKDALVIGDWWVIAPLGYVKYIDGLRPDVKLSPAFSLASQEKYQREIRRDSLKQFPAVYAAEMISNCITDLRSKYILLPQGPVFRVMVNATDSSLVLSSYQGTPRYLFGDKLALIGWEIGSKTIQSGKPVNLTLYWHSRQPSQADEDYDVFVFLVPRVTQPGEAKLWPWIDKNPLAYKLLPLKDWKQGQTLAEKHYIFVTTDAADPGEYDLRVKVRSGGKPAQFLPVTTPSGQALGKEANLEMLEVKTN